MFKKVRNRERLEKRKKKRRVKPYELCLKGRDLPGLDEEFKKGLEFPNHPEVDKMILSISPTEGIWKDYIHRISIDIPRLYPMTPPLCIFVTKIWHPAVDNDFGSISEYSLSILRNEYRPQVGLNTIFIHLKSLFLEPNTEFPNNNEAAYQYEKDFEGFEVKAREYMKKYAKLDPRLALKQSKEDFKDRTDFLLNNFELIFPGQEVQFDNFKGFKWFNEPTEYSLSEDEKTLTVFSSPIVDFWTETWYSDYNPDSGNFFYKEFPSYEVRNMTMKVAFRGDYEPLFDQAGLMVRLDENYWLKTGVEFNEECLCASAVVTNGFSDWNIVTLCDHDKARFLYLKMFIDDKNFLEISFSVDGGETYKLLRLSKLPIDKYSSVKLGIMVASPINKEGFKSVFKDFLISTQEEDHCYISEKVVPI